MKYMLLMSHAPVDGAPPLHEWAPEENKASWAHMGQIHRELTKSGELLGTEGLSGPEATKIVTSDASVPVVTDGPFPEAKEFLAGYWIVEVDRPERAYEIAAKASAAPGPGGAPLIIPIEVRQVMSAPLPADA